MVISPVELPRVRRRLPPEARKLQIIEAAERLLQARGAEARVEDIAAEAGVAKGTVFLYFPTYDDLLVVLRKRFVRAFDAAHPEPTGAAGAIDWRELIPRQAEAFIDYAAARSRLGAVIFHPDLTARRPMTDAGVKRMEAIIRAGQEAGAFAPVDPAATAGLLFAAMHHALDVVAAGGDRETMIRALRHLIQSTLDGAGGG